MKIVHCSKCGEKREVNQFVYNLINKKEIKSLCPSCRDTNTFTYRCPNCNVKKKIFKKSYEKFDSGNYEYLCAICNEDKNKIKCKKCGKKYYVKKIEKQLYIDGLISTLCKTCQQKINKITVVYLPCPKCKKNVPKSINDAAHIKYGRNTYKINNMRKEICTDCRDKQKLIIEVKKEYTVSGTECKITEAGNFQESERCIHFDGCKNKNLCLDTAIKHKLIGFVSITQKVVKKD